MGDEIENLFYKFKMWINQQNVKVCEISFLIEKDVKYFYQRIDDLYQVNLMLDNFLVIWYMKQLDLNKLMWWMGLFIGYEKDIKYYIFNYLIFKVFIYEYEGEILMVVMLGNGDGLDVVQMESECNLIGMYMVVGFEVVFCSVECDVKVFKDVEDYGMFFGVFCSFNGFYQEIKVNELLVFLYDVVFELSEICWFS